MSVGWEPRACWRAHERCHAAELCADATLEGEGRARGRLVERLCERELLPDALVAGVALGIFDVVDNLVDDVGILLLLFLSDALVFQHSLPLRW